MEPFHYVVSSDGFDDKLWIRILLLLSFYLFTFIFMTLFFFWWAGMDRSEVRPAVDRKPIRGRAGLYWLSLIGTKLESQPKNHDEKTVEKRADPESDEDDNNCGDISSNETSVKIPSYVPILYSKETIWEMRSLFLAFCFSFSFCFPSSYDECLTNTKPTG